MPVEAMRFMIQLIRGFKDILPAESELWQYIEGTAVALLNDFGYKEIRVPIMERTELFARSIGEDTDIVEKEMYTFSDRSDDLLTLRPEATASIVRSYIQHKLYMPDPVRKFYTIGPMFRRERPQKGRYRQFYQIDAEVFGVASAYVDAELIYLLKLLFDRLGISDTRARVNSLGCPVCRPDFKDALMAFLADKTDRLCADCNRRKDRNPLRVLDCKVPTCQEAINGVPAISDHLCTDCQAHFSVLTAALGSLNVPYEVDRRLVRGLDYYTRTTFEMQTDLLGAQSAVAGGGRYDGLVKSLGGPDTPATGFAVGFDRLAELVALRGETFDRQPALYIAALGPACQAMAFLWMTALAEGGITAEMDFDDRSLKSQMKRADRSGAAYVFIVGENEREAGVGTLRDMRTKTQVDIPLDDAVAHIRRILCERK